MPPVIDSTENPSQECIVSPPASYMPAISATVASYNMLNSRLPFSQKEESVLLFAAVYGGAAMEAIPVINGTYSCDEGKPFSADGRLNDLRLKCGIDRQIQKNNTTRRKVSGN